MNKLKYESPTTTYTVVVEKENLLAGSSTDKPTGNCSCGCGPDCCQSRGDCRGNGLTGCDHKAREAFDFDDETSWNVTW